MDISEFWTDIGVVLLLIVSVKGWGWARAIKGKWWRKGAKTASGLVSVGATLFLMLALLMEVVSVVRAPNLPSPDGRYVVVRSLVGQGALGDDYGTLRLRRAWLPWGPMVYDGIGMWNFRTHRMTYPQVEWAGSSKLVIRYSKDDRDTLCGGRVGDVEVECVAR